MEDRAAGAESGDTWRRRGRETDGIRKEVNEEDKKDDLEDGMWRLGRKGKNSDGNNMLMEARKSR